MDDGVSASRTVYEDAEDATTNGWYRYNRGSIANIDGGANGSNRSIEISGYIENDVFSLTTGNGFDWNNTSEFFAEFSVAFDEPDSGVIYFQIGTNKGIKYLVYTGATIKHNDQRDIAYFDLDVVADAQWHTIQRDLKDDLATRWPNVQLEAVKGLFVYGSIKLDNIVLSEFE